MAFINKQELNKFAGIYDINLDGKTWQEQQKIVQAELREHGFSIAKDGTVYDAGNESIEEDMPVVHEKRPSNEVDEADAEEALKAVLDQEIEIAPYIPWTKTQLIKYDEDLGERNDVEEVYFDINSRVRSAGERDMATSTYRVKGTKRKVVAQSSLPKTNAGVKYRPSKDLVPVIYDNKHEGYVWNNSSFPNVKGLMLASGYYEEFKDYFDSKKNPQNIFYVAGKMLAVSKPVTEHVFRLIEERAEHDSKVRGY